MVEQVVSLFNPFHFTNVEYPFHDKHKDKIHILFMSLTNVIRYIISNSWFEYLCISYYYFEKNFIFSWIYPIRNKEIFWNLWSMLYKRVTVRKFANATKPFIILSRPVKRMLDLLLTELNLTGGNWRKEHLYIYIYIFIYI